MSTYFTTVEAPGSLVSSSASKPAFGWQARAIEAFRQDKSNSESELQIELARRVSVLTGCNIPAILAYADPDRRTARVSLNGVSFRLARNQVMLLAPCAYCGVREFQSPPIESDADLGYALSVWKPYCLDCMPQDSNDWD